VSLQRLAEIVSLVPGLGPSTRLLDVGSGTGCLITHLQARGVADITAVDLSAAMLEQLSARFPAPSVCGNDPGENVGGKRRAQAPGVDVKEQYDSMIALYVAMIQMSA
jgi:cyclopropane fatty-acyl-phospholipid synthase-like methyltransferase